MAVSMSMSVSVAHDGDRLGRTIHWHTWGRTHVTGWGWAVRDMARGGMIVGLWSVRLRGRGIVLGRLGMMAVRHFGRRFRGRLMAVLSCRVCFADQH